MKKPGEIVDLEGARAKREMDTILALVQPGVPARHALNLTGKNLHVTGFAQGHKDTEGVRIRTNLLIYDKDDASGVALASIRLTEEQWTELKRVGDGFFESTRKALVNATRGSDALE